MRKLFLIITTIIFTFTFNSVFAAEIEVKMLNKDADGNKMIFEPVKKNIKHQNKKIEMIDINSNNEIHSVSSMNSTTFPEFRKF